MITRTENNGSENISNAVDKSNEEGVKQNDPLQALQVA